MVKAPARAELPALTVVAVPVDDLVLLPDNPRKGEVDRVAASLARFGQRKAITARRSDRAVTAGNHTLLAARSLGWSHVAVTWFDDDDVTSRAWALTDNRIPELGGYDNEMLAEAISAIAEIDPDLLEVTGWTPDDLAGLLADLVPKPMPLTDPDDAPARPKKARAKPGDLFVLGPHRVLCGDSRVAANVERLVAGAAVDLVWTDPPYGVAYVGGTKDALRLENDDLTAAEDTEAMLRDAFTAALAVCRKGAAWYVASPGGPEMLPFAKVLTDLGVWRQTITWVKDRFVLGRSDFHYRHEPILYGSEPAGDPPALPPFEYSSEHEALIYGWKPGAAHTPPPDRRQDTVWEIPRPSSSADHPTMKPTELIGRALKNSSEPGAVVLDVFGGDGSTLIACEQLDRRGHMLELDPRFVDVICRRWQEHTGCDVVLESTGARVDFTRNG